MHNGRGWWQPVTVGLFGMAVRPAPLLYILVFFSHVRNFAYVAVYNTEPTHLVTEHVYETLI